MTAKFSIILTTYNWPHALNIILDILLPQLYRHIDVELVIADDGSDASTKDIISVYQQKLLSRIKHVWHEDKGFRKSTIINKAVRSSQGDYLFFLDGDCIPFPDYIFWHKKLAQSGFFVAGNRVLLNQKLTSDIIANPYKIEQIFRWGIINWILARVTQQVNKISASWRCDSKSRWRYFRQNNWKYPKGCNFGVSRVDFYAVNGYDETFEGWGHEDADLFIRLLHNNVKIKDGRHAIAVLHLWHNLVDRTRENANYQRLIKERVSDRDFVQAVKGISNRIIT